MGTVMGMGPDPRRGIKLGPDGRVLKRATLHVLLDADMESKLEAVCAGHVPPITRTGIVREWIYREHATMLARTAESELLARKVMRMGQLATGKKAHIRKPGDPDFYLSRWNNSAREEGPFETAKEAASVHSHGAYTVKCWDMPDGSVREHTDYTGPKFGERAAPLATESSLDVRKRAIPPQVVKYWQIAHRTNDSEPYHVELFVCDADAMAYSRTLPADVRDVEFLEPL